MIPRLGSEHAEYIRAPATFFSDLGNLHDAEIQLVEWSPPHQEVVFLIDDLYSNFIDLPEYPGLQPVRLAVEGVSKLEANVTRDKMSLRVMDFEVEETSADSSLQITVKFTPAGQIRIVGTSIAFRPL